MSKYKKDKALSNIIKLHIKKRCRFVSLWLLVIFFSIESKNGIKTLAQSNMDITETASSLDSVEVAHPPDSDDILSTENGSLSDDLSLVEGSDALPADGSDLIKQSSKAEVDQAESYDSDSYESSSSSISDYREQISNSRDKIDEYEKRKDELSGLISDLDATLEELSGLKNDAASYISVLDDNISAKDTQIEELSLEIEDVSAEIETTKEELNLAKENEAVQYDNMKLRIQYMYENGSKSMLNTLLDSGSISEFLNKAEYISNVTQYDRDKLDEFVDLTLAIEAKEEELLSKQELLNVAEEKLQEERNAIEVLLQEKQTEIENYNIQISGAQADADSLNADMASIQAAIQAEEGAMAAAEERIRREEEEARKKAEEAGETYTPKSAGDIYFSWPCPSSSRITSYFGDRESPTEGASTNHKGIDIGASSGSSVIAAATGEVVIATYSTSAGNYIMLSHGGGVYTVYMHMQSMSVQVGDEVTGGEQIGLVGSTGYSTGPHLHFGIRIDGSYVDPLDYVTP